MTAATKPKPKGKRQDVIGPIVTLIRVAADRGKISAAQLSKAADIPYSRAWELLHGTGHRKLANIERALETLAPDVVAAIRRKAEKLGQA